MTKRIVIALGSAARDRDRVRQLQHGRHETGVRRVDAIERPDRDVARLVDMGRRVLRHGRFRLDPSHRGGWDLHANHHAFRGHEQPGESEDVDGNDHHERQPGDSQNTRLGVVSSDSRSG
jgi:hypothetical protein